MSDKPLSPRHERFDIVELGVRTNSKQEHRRLEFVWSDGRDLTKPGRFPGWSGTAPD
jgi:hypothetical protein